MKKTAANHNNFNLQEQYKHHNKNRQYNLLKHKILITRTRGKNQSVYTKQHQWNIQLIKWYNKQKKSIDINS